MYKKFIDFLVKFYSGTVSWKIGKWYMSGVKPYLGFFFLLWGILKVIQVSVTGITYWAWWDYIMTILIIPQIIAGFSMFAVNEQKRLNQLEKNKDNYKL